ncbi:MAG: (1-_4)-alpha-D-glucan 1-alpha-D-glucosylmutase [Acidimicrobiaceae bacterium]|jgi:(1->4)-alpha-D-glucan 1-alpha-D-glucosylmutase
MSRNLVGTYRLQLRPGFGFRDAAAIVPYLRDLGVSHLYLSPSFEATNGSTHGYDIVDPNRLREELGGADAFNHLVDVAHGDGLGIVLDIVPHHMAAAPENAWWWSVLELGRDSPYAFHFDIDWDPPERRLRGTILLPVLGDHYGRVLEAGELQLARDAQGALIARYFDHVAPLSPDTADELWAQAGRLGCEVEVVLDEVNKDVDRLDAILERQHHRFARWQAAAHELDYRRFFDVDSLVALRAERPAVFDDTHRLIGALVSDGRIDGLRVDHVDGLRDPEGYLARLRAIAPEAWITVEKILRPAETTPDNWAVDGTTGYDFLATVAGVLVDPVGVDRLVEAYGRLTGDDSTYAGTRLAARREALRDSLDADLERVVAALMRVCERNRRWRDFTRNELRDVVTEVCVHASAYRSYIRPGVEPTNADRAFVARAIDGALDDRSDLDPDLLDLLRQLLLGEMVGDDESAVMARFQQLTGPVAAKGEEDTAFYRWVPLLCLNEVGTDPDESTLTVAQFHARCRALQRNWPVTMLTTSTHDTKRSEDARARLAVLSEISEDWIATVGGWFDANDGYRDRKLDAPDRRDEWFIYQTLVGAHPLPLERAWPVIEKSLRESKRRTSWTRTNDAYEAATRRFVESILTDDIFVADLDRLVAPIDEPGQINALAQVALRMLSPGVPDTYQGAELWDLSLVDPDNRRPVDYRERTEALAAIANLPAAALWTEHRAAGWPKLALLRACLVLRRRHPDGFGRAGSYDPLTVTGTDAERVIAFARGGEAVAVVPRLPRVGPPDDAVIALPDGEWTNVLTGDRHSGEVPFGKLCDGFPLAVLEIDVAPAV